MDLSVWIHMLRKGPEHKPRESLDEDLRLRRHDDGDYGMDIPIVSKES